MMQFDMTPICEALLTLLFCVITSVLIPMIKRRTNNEQRDEIRGWVGLAVDAAEMLYKGNGRGEDKLAFVLDFLKERGFKIDDSELRVLIEAAVRQIQSEKMWMEVELEREVEVDEA